MDDRDELNAESIRPPSALSISQSGAVLFVGGIGLLTAMNAISKYLTIDYPFLEVTWARYVFHLCSVTLLLGIGRVRAATRTKAFSLQVARSLLLLGAAYLFVLSLRTLPLAEATAIGFMSPPILAILSAVMLREKVDGHCWTAVIVGFIGVLVITRPGSDIFRPGAIAALGSAVCWSSGLALTKRIGSIDDELTTLIYTALVGTVAASVAVPWTWLTPSPATWAFMAVMGLLGAGGHFMLIAAFARAPAASLAPFNYSQLIWAIAIGAAVWGDIPDRMTLCGTAIIVASGVYVWHFERTAS